MDKLDTDKIEKLERLEDELQQVKQNERAMFTQAKAKHGDKTLEIERDGEKVEVTENDLWNELQDPTATDEGKQQAKEILKDRHAGVFDKMEQEKELAKEISETFTEVFGFNFKQISPARFLKIVRVFTEYYLDEKLDDYE